MAQQNSTIQDMKRALEALRSGVPNRDAVNVLGCEQKVVEDRFHLQLAQVKANSSDEIQSRGMLIAGDFGTGKSHMLEHMKTIALDQNFVCSHIVISKDTPLYDSAKLFFAAVECAVAPRITGDTIQEIGLQLDTRTPEWTNLFTWANNEERSGLSQIFPATMLLNEHLNNDPEMSEKVRGFWAGSKLSLPDIKIGMSQIGMPSVYKINRVHPKQLSLQHFKFASRLIRAAGYSGWVLLIDEVENVSHYSRIQRGRSYGELARWLGQVESDQYMALTTVAAITVDFNSAVLNLKGDIHRVIPVLQSKGTDEYRGYANRAETGMRIIDRERVELLAPNQTTLDTTYEKLKHVHATAFDWEPPDISGSSKLSSTKPMRQHIRRWINEWDIRRLYPGLSPDIEESPLTSDYTENPDFEIPSADSPTNLTDAE